MRVISWNCRGLGKSFAVLQYQKIALKFKPDICRGRFYDNGRKCENGPNLPLDSLEVFIMENQVQNSKCIMNKRLMVL